MEEDHITEVSETLREKLDIRSGASSPVFPTSEVPIREQMTSKIALIGVPGCMTMVYSPHDCYASIME